jgi:GH18 family chitinase
MNRRNTRVKHHSGVGDTLKSISRYIHRGASPEQLNLGLGYYVKWFMVKPGCDPERPIDCPTELLEDPETGADLGGTGAFSWHDEVPEDLAESFARAKKDGHRFYPDSDYGCLDTVENRWWTWDSPPAISKKIETWLRYQKLGGVFAWGLGEDAPEFTNFKATMEATDRLEDRMRKDEL